MLDESARTTDLMERRFLIDPRKIFSDHPLDDVQSVSVKRYSAFNRTSKTHVTAQNHDERY
jgi:hypothetical protein